jgi:hypothetical protein
MNRTLAAASALGFALVAGVTASRPALAQFPPAGPAGPAGPQCNDFVKLREDAQKKASLVQAASLHKEDRKTMCEAMIHFSAAEGLALKFMQDNMAWCGIPQQAIDNAKVNHAKTVQFQTAVCAEGPTKPKAPTLSDAINTPTVDTGKNTRTGQGTFDTLTGNPLAK